MPPFSVLDTRSGYWQDRQRSWISLGIQWRARPQRGARGRRHLRFRMPTGASGGGLGIPARGEGEGAGAHGLGRGPRARSARRATARGGHRRLAGALVQESHADYKARMRAEAAGTIGQLGRPRGSAAERRHAARGLRRQLRPGGGRECLGRQGTRCSGPGTLRAGLPLVQPGGRPRGRSRPAAACAGSWRPRSGPLFGTDLSVPQLEANALQVPPIRRTWQDWHPGHWSTTRLGSTGRAEPAAVRGRGHGRPDFTCPPYYDLEVYSDDLADLSRASTRESPVLGYRECTAAAAPRWRPDLRRRVVGEVRDKKGHCHGLVPDHPGLRGRRPAVLQRGHPWSRAWAACPFAPRACSRPAGTRVRPPERAGVRERLVEGRVRGVRGRARRIRRGGHQRARRARRGGHLRPPAFKEDNAILEATTARPTTAIREPARTRAVRDRPQARIRSGHPAGHECTRCGKRRGDPPRRIDVAHEAGIHEPGGDARLDCAPETEHERRVDAARARIRRPGWAPRTRFGSSAASRRPRWPTGPGWPYPPCAYQTHGQARPDGRAHARRGARAALAPAMICTSTPACAAGCGPARSCPAGLRGVRGRGHGWLAALAAGGDRGRLG